MRRVVITGIGIVSSIGNDVETVRTSLKEGRSGISFAHGMHHVAQILISVFRPGFRTFLAELAVPFRFFKTKSGSLAPTPIFRLFAKVSAFVCGSGRLAFATVTR